MIQLLPSSAVELDATFFVDGSCRLEVQIGEWKFAGALLGEYPKRLAGYGVVGGFLALTIAENQDGSRLVGERFGFRTWRRLRHALVVITTRAFIAQAVNFISQTIYFPRQRIVAAIIILGRALVSD